MSWPCDFFVEATHAGNLKSIQMLDYQSQCISFIYQLQYISFNVSFSNYQFKIMSFNLSVLINAFPTININISVSIYHLETLLLEQSS